MREELSFLLGRDSRIGQVETASSGAEALQHLERVDVDAVFLDIAMPGLSGIDVARVLGRFKHPPRVVFVTAFEAHAVEGFEINAVDCLLKPVSDERVEEAIRRVVEADGSSTVVPADETIPVELAGVTRFIQRSDVRYAEAQGDYVRLHTDQGSHLLRAPLTHLEEEWRDAGFVRIHRRLLVSLPHVKEVPFDHGRCTVIVDDVELQVSRRHTPDLRELLVRRAQPARGQVHG